MTYKRHHLRLGILIPCILPFAIEYTEINCMSNSLTLSVTPPVSCLYNGYMNHAYCFPQIQIYALSSL